VSTVCPIDAIYCCSNVEQSCNNKNIPSDNYGCMRWLDYGKVSGCDCHCGCIGWLNSRMYVNHVNPPRHDRYLTATVGAWDGYIEAICQEQYERALFQRVV
jgi:hypothetical protein